MRCISPFTDLIGKLVFRTLVLGLCLGLGACALQVNPGFDAEIGPLDTHGTDVDEQDLDGVFVLGTHTAGASGAEEFELLADNQSLDIVFGHQGLWMIVLALQVDGSVQGDIDVTGSLSVDGISVGSLTLKQQHLQGADDGHRYLLNFFLILDEPGQGGEEGEVQMKVTVANGTTVTLSRTVLLQGGPESEF
jgi:hypothetical protein